MSHYYFFIVLRRPTRPKLFPYTTLFRSTQLSIPTARTTKAPRGAPSSFRALAGEPVREPGGQVVEEAVHLGRAVAMARVDGPYRGVVMAIGVEHRDQLAAGEVGVHVVVGQLGQPQPLERGVEQGGTGVGAPDAWHPHLATHSLHGEAPVVPAAHQAAVAGELGQRVGLGDMGEVGRGPHHIFT